LLIDILKGNTESVKEYSFVEFKEEEKKMVEQESENDL